MGKRSNFERRERDFYPTPKEAVIPLINNIGKDSITFAEPCCGTGELIFHLQDAGLTCVWASDVEDRVGEGMVFDMDALDLEEVHLSSMVHADYIITNPPWDRKILHPMINHFRMLRPTWLLFDADWMHTKQAIPYLKSCSLIISVGRVKWIPDSKHTGKDNCCWYKFENHENVITEFINR